jgi:hypothetical protein
MKLNDTIKQISKDTAATFFSVATNGSKKIKEFIINCSDLDDYNNVDIRDSKKYKLLFNDIQQMTGPTLYYFEILSNHSSYDIVSSIQKYSATKNAKTVPAIKKQLTESKVLYVGKVKRNMWGRLIQHLGFYKVERTQGLQLFYWAKKLSLTVKITVVEFEPDMANLIGVLENELAAKLKPILGKHKL